MKKGMKQNARAVLIGFLVLLSGIMFFLSYQELFNPGVREEKVSYYDYLKKSDINYTVSLKPNLLYASPTVGEGKTYVTNFVDHINARFSYVFEGDSPADIKGDYEIVARLEGLVGTGADNTEKTIWSKEFKVIPKTGFNLKDKKFSLTKDIPININQYNALAGQISQASNIVTTPKLSYKLIINLKAETEKGLIEDGQAPTITIPLNISYFEIEKKGTGEKPGAIEVTKNVKLSVNTKLAIVYSSILAAALFLLLYIIFYTAAVEEEPLTKTLQKIFKKHGDRLVALNNDFDLTEKTCFKVHSIEDLVRVADDLERPVLYTYRGGLDKITTFYVTDGRDVYILDLKDTFPEQKPVDWKARIGENSVSDTSLRTDSQSSI